MEMDLKDLMKKKHGFWGSLVRTRTGVSSLNFFLIATTIIGVVLLATVVFAIIWEVLHNDTVTSDISGWAAFIGAVGTLFASAGVAKGWSNWAENKFNPNGGPENDEENDEEALGDPEEQVETDGFRNRGDFFPKRTVRESADTSSESAVEEAE